MRKDEYLVLPNPSIHTALLCAKPRVQDLEQQDEEAPLLGGVPHLQWKPALFTSMPFAKCPVFALF